MQSQILKKGSLVGGTLLVAGCCIGAGMLGLPVASAEAGFPPSIVMFFISWLFMLTTGLLLLEVNLWVGEETSIVTMAKRTLGLPGKIASWFLFLFLFYCVLVAYVSASGQLFTEFIQVTAGKSLPDSVGSLIFCIFFGLLLYLGTGAIDSFNRLLMFGLLISYAVLVAIGGSQVNPQLLTRSNWSYATAVIPIAVFSFGFHNLVPSLTTYFKGDKKSLTLSILIGSAIPLAIYLVWEWIILGIVPLQDFKTALYKGDIVTEALKTTVGASWILGFAQAFAFFAIITSFLSVALSFVDFLADGLNVKRTPRGKLLLILLVLLPPFLCALVYPDIFLIALKTAGGFGSVLLFGILPALMVWKGRYILKLEDKSIVPGGRILLIAVIAFSLWVMALQFYNFMGDA